jgi:hypothetical protein
MIAFQVTYIATDFSLKFKNEGYFYQLFKYGLKLVKFC